MAIVILRTCPILTECAQPAGYECTSRLGMSCLVLLSADKPPPSLGSDFLWTNPSAELRCYADTRVGHYTIMEASEPRYDPPKTGLGSWPGILFCLQQLNG